MINYAVEGVSFDPFVDNGLSISLFNSENELLGLPNENPGSRDVGITGYATITGLINLGYANGSISWWQYPTVAWNDTTATYVAWGGWSGASVPLIDAQKYNGDNKWYVGFIPGADSRVQVAASATNWIQNTWTHYLFTWVNGGNSLFYCNGVQIASGATTTANNSSDFQYGKNHDGANPSFPGRLAGLAIWNSTLSDFDALRLAGGVSPNCIDPQHRIFYSTFQGINTPEIDLWGGKVITLTNNPIPASGPVIINQRKSLDGGLRYGNPLRPYDSTRKLWVA